MAATILAVALTALAQLLALSTWTNSRANATTRAVLLAQQKMEQLKALALGFDASGLPLTDSTTDTASAPEAPTGGTGLSPSPPDVLRSNAPGYVDYLDQAGVVLGAGPDPPAATAYIRRWSVEPLPADPDNTLVLQVMVTRNRGAALTSDARRPGDVWLLSVKTRKSA